MVQHRWRPRGQWGPHRSTGDCSDWTTVWFTYERLPKAHTECRGGLPRRWVVERSMAWIGSNRRRSKDDAYRTATSEAWGYLSRIRLLLKRLAGEQIQPAFQDRRIA
jgi:putative transposase